MKANPNSTHFRNFRSRNPNSKVASERLNQVGDLMSMLKPQTSVWGFNANSKVASERLNQVGDLMSMQKPQTSVWGFNANSKVASERLNQVGDLMFMLKPQTSVWGFNANSKVASERRFMVKFKFILLFIILLQSTTPIQARKIKTRHSIPKQTEKSIKDTPIESPDSIISLSIDSLTFTDKILPSIRFYGFDKTVTSSMESFFISNALDSAITGMEIEITYFDMQGRQLHKRTVPLSVNVPPHETIRTDIKSWDTQKSFYYHKSAKPKRQATPFNVKLRLLSLIQKREAIQPPQ